VSSTPQREPKRQKVSADEKLSDATAPDHVPELQLFAGLTTEDGAWRTTTRILGGPLWSAQKHEFPEIEVIVFN
jgi:hypothetical protein